MENRIRNNSGEVREVRENEAAQPPSGSSALADEVPTHQPDSIQAQAAEAVAHIERGNYQGASRIIRKLSAGPYPGLLGAVWSKVEDRRNGAHFVPHRDRLIKVMLSGLEEGNQKKSAAAIDALLFSGMTRKELSAKLNESSLPRAKALAKEVDFIRSGTGQGTGAQLWGLARSLSQLDNYQERVEDLKRALDSVFLSKSGPDESAKPASTLSLLQSEENFSQHLGFRLNSPSSEGSEVTLTWLSGAIYEGVLPKLRSLKDDPACTAEKLAQDLNLEELGNLRRSIQAIYDAEGMMRISSMLSHDTVVAHCKELLKRIDSAIATQKARTTPYA